MNPTLKRAFLIGLLVLTGLATIFTLAVVFLASGRRGNEFGIMSGLGIGYLLLISFAAFTAVDHRFWRFPAFLGILLAVFMMVAMPIFAWLEANRVYSYGSSVSSTYFTSASWYELMEKLVGSGLSIAGFLCFLAFVMAPRMKLFGILVQIGTALSLLLLVILFLMIFWIERFMRDEVAEQIFFTAFILTVAGILCSALLGKFFGIKIIRPVSYVAANIHLTCPRCMKDQDLAVGDSACAFCKLKIKIDIEEPLCPKCGYNLHNLTRPICPECGTHFADSDSPAAPHSAMPQPAPAIPAQRP